MAQTQCPNCGGFKTESDRDSAIGTTLTLMFVTVGLYIAFFPIWLLHISSSDPSKWTCKLCGYRWVQKPGEVLPTTVRPDLIAKGEEKLREEERQRAAALYWQQQRQEK